MPQKGVHPVTAADVDMWCKWYRWKVRCGYLDSGTGEKRHYGGLNEKNRRVLPFERVAKISCHGRWTATRNKKIQLHGYQKSSGALPMTRSKSVEVQHGVHAEPSQAAREYSFLTNLLVSKRVVRSAMEAVQLAELDYGALVDKALTVSMLRLKVEWQRT